MAKYSFIIPVYNVERYLDECINSILKQTYKDFEIILVDDGSTDSSPEICDKYGKKQRCIKIIHQENGGLSVARNNGLKLAAGRFIIFLDSDDYWIDNCGLERLDELTDTIPDIIYFSSYGLYENAGGKLVKDRYSYPEFFNGLSSKKVLEHMVKKDLFNLSSCKKVYSRSFLVNNNLWFKEGIKSEDIDFNLRAAICLPNCRFYTKPLYVYRHREGSISKTIDDKHLHDYLSIIKDFATYSFEEADTKKYILSYLGYQHALLSAYCTIANSRTSNQIIEELKAYTFLYKYRDYPRTKKISDVLNTFGYWITRHLLAIYLKRLI